MPVRAEDIAEFCARFSESELREAHFKSEGLELFVSKDPDELGIATFLSETVEMESAGSPEEDSAPAPSMEIRAPLFGTLRFTKGAHDAPATAQGEVVHAGDVIAVIHVLDDQTPVKADQSGVISKIYVDDGALVDFDAPLFSITATE